MKEILSDNIGKDVVKNMIDDDALETGVKEKKSKTGSIFTWLFDFYLSFLVTIGA